jgi:hypothetical protein
MAVLHLLVVWVLVRLKQQLLVLEVLGHLLI